MVIARSLGIVRVVAGVEDIAQDAGASGIFWSPAVQLSMGDAAPGRRTINWFTRSLPSCVVPEMMACSSDVIEGQEIPYPTSLLHTPCSSTVWPEARFLARVFLSDPRTS